ncbi:MAG: PD-(D/E)XK nuclease family transposase [Alphaproteobacteria bacterium]|nr:MAG: PD-(D/E)XK nuclease family transposase [Alphaproteobacteria bacterium]
MTPILRSLFRVSLIGMLALSFGVDASWRVVAEELGALAGVTASRAVRVAGVMPAHRLRGLRSGLCYSDWGTPIRRGYSLSSVLAMDTAPSRRETRRRGQIYGIPTFDALFKYVLSHGNVRPSFFHAFIPGLPIVESELLDVHMNPIQGLQILRDFIHSKETNALVKRLSEASHVHVESPGDEGYAQDPEGTSFLHRLLHNFEDLRVAFPRARYEGTMDFVCKLKTGGFAMVEMQVIPHDYWDERALAYLAAFYGNQLARGERWKDIRKVIGINILGGGKNLTVHWKDTPDQWLRHYKFQEQLHTPKRYIEGVELFQYSIMNAPPALDNQEQQDWITFFRHAARMTEADVVRTIHTPAVREAFELAKIRNLPEEVYDAYERTEERFDNYSQYTQEQRDEGKEQALINLAQTWHGKGKTVAQIADLLDKDETWVNQAITEEIDENKDERS